MADTSKLLEKLDEIKQKLIELDQQKKNLKDQLRTDGLIIYDQIRANGWVDEDVKRLLTNQDTYYINNHMIDQIKKYLTTNRASEWKKQLNIPFEIVEIRRLVFDGTQVEKVQFMEQGRHLSVGFYSSWAGKHSEYTNYHYFIKYLGKPCRAYMIMSSSLDLEKTNAPANNYRTIKLNKNNYFHGVLVGVAPKSDKIYVFNGDSTTEYLFPNQKQGLIEAIEAEMQQTHDIIKQNMSLNLVDKHPFIRYYAKQLNDGYI